MGLLIPWCAFLGVAGTAPADTVSGERVKWLEAGLRPSWLPQNLCSHLKICLTLARRVVSVRVPSCTGGAATPVCVCILKFATRHGSAVELSSTTTPSSLLLDSAGQQRRPSG